MNFNDYVQHDALGLAALVAQGQVTATELLGAALARTDAVNPAINALVCDLRQAAAALACALPTGPFAGVPFLIKDFLQDIAGTPTTGGSRALAQVPAAETSDVVRLWQEAGLVIFGKTNTPEFGSKNVSEPMLFGPARNPWDTTRTPGGSSGGSAAAVAAGIVPVAGANDGGGSIRIPAAACGLFGLKPGRGRVSMGPSIGEGMNGAAVQGVVSRSVRDSAAMLDLLQVPQPHAPYLLTRPATPYLGDLQRPPAALRIGFSTASPIGTPISAEAEAAVQDAASLLTSLGHHVEEAAPAIDGMQLSKDFLQAWFCYQAALVDDIRRTTGARRRDFEFDTRIMAALGHTTSAPDLVACEARWQTYTRALAGFHSRYDMWLSPTLAGPAPRIGEHATPFGLRIGGEVVMALGLSGLLRHTSMLEDTITQNLAWTPYTQLANLTGRPAMSVPLYWTATGLPLGVQFVGALGTESLLLRLAAQLEQARPWFHRRPQEAGLLSTRAG